MTTNSLLAACVTSALALICGCSQESALPTQAPPIPGGVHGDSELHILSNAHCKAIFCGDPDTETGPDYSQALVEDLRRLEAKPRSTMEAMAYLRLRACTRR